MKKPRTRIVNKTKNSVTLDFKGDIGQVTTTWKEFNEIYVIEDNIWAVFNDAAWEKVKERKKKVEKEVQRLVKKEEGVTLDSTADEVVNILGCSKERAIQIIKAKMKRLNPKPVKKKKPAENKQRKRTAGFTLGDVPGFEKLKKL
jgi:hypothetical protein